MEFERLELLIGDKINELKEKNVLVLGIGGVGGYATESLVRNGIGNITIVDYDTVDITNINRQIIATHSSIGKKKIDVMEERIKDINPNCNVIKYDLFYEEKNKDIIFNNKIDYVIDCCDSLESKKILIMECVKRNIPVISCMGTGNKFNPQSFHYAKLKKTEYDPLAKKLRFLLKDNKECLEIMTLYSDELPKKISDKIGSTSFVPSVAGLLLTSYVINEFLKGE